MSLTSEIELKLRVHAEDVPLLQQRLAQLASSRIQNVDNVYFDTADRRLLLAKAGLRLRCLTLNGHKRWVQTFKTDSGGDALSVRGEWETPAPGAKLHLEALATSPLTTLLGVEPNQMARAADALQAVFSTDFVRESWDLVWQGSCIEAALDVGEIRAAGCIRPILELELELKQGQAYALVQLAQWLSQPATHEPILRLLPYAPSKAARGYALFRREPEQVIPAARMTEWPQRSQFDWSWTSSRALRHWLWSGMQIVLANLEDLPSDNGNAEFVHQARIATRAMRVAALSLGSADGHAAKMSKRLRPLSALLGEARDADVMLARTLPALHADAGDSDQARHQVWQKRLQARRREAYLALQGYLNSAAWAQTTLAFLAWRFTEETAIEPSLGSWFPDRVQMRFARLQKALATYAEATLRQRHRLRLRAKALRYLYQYLPLARASDHLAERLAALSAFQEAAGHEHDLAVMQHALHHDSVIHTTSSTTLEHHLERLRQKAAKRSRQSALALAKVL